jgi:1,4-dihydroxy-2-naphthoyl-CoA hydrolase
MQDMKDSMQRTLKGMFGETLGIRFLEVTADRVAAEMDVRDDLCTTGKVMHGGAIMAFADTLGAYATSLNLPPGAGTTTLESKTNFLGPAPAGTKITGECEPVHKGKRTMVWRTRVTGEGGRPVAVVQQTQMVLEAPKSEQETLTELFAGKSDVEQKALLARLERGGAAIYRVLASREGDEKMREALLRAAEREEQNAEVLEGG